MYIVRKKKSSIFIVKKKRYNITPRIITYRISLSRERDDAFFARERKAENKIRHNVYIYVIYKKERKDTTERVQNASYKREKEREREKTR